MFGRRYYGARFFGARYFGDGGSAPAVDGSYMGARFFGRRFFATRYFSPEAGTGSQWDVEVPTQGPALAGTFDASGNFGWGWGLSPSAAVALSATFDASGDFQFISGAQPFDLVPSGAAAFSATIDASGDFAFYRDISLVPSGAAALSGTFAASGDFAYSSAPVAPPTPQGGGSGYPATNLKRRLQRDQERNEAELDEVLDLIMALAAAGVLD